MHKIKVNITRNALGNYVVYPKRKDIRDAIRKYLREEWKINSEGGILIQDNHDAQLEVFNVTPEQRKDLDNGWDVVKLINPYEYLQMYGWDCHRAIEVGNKTSKVIEL